MLLSMSELQILGNLISVSTGAYIYDIQIFGEHCLLQLHSTRSSH